MLICNSILIVSFCFSSRRRHTRWPRDWSSDVCSSDLIYDGPQVMDKRSWFQEKLNELETSDIQHVADFLLEEVIRENEGHIFDDMTVIVAKIERNKPKWSSIPVHLADA